MASHDQLQRRFVGQTGTRSVSFWDGHTWKHVHGYHDEVNHSPDGFAWGYGGSGPSQLAYAVLRTLGFSKQFAFQWYQTLKFKLIAQFPIDEPCKFTEGDVLRALEMHNAQKR